MDINKLDIGYKFNNIDLLNTAFTHLSYSNEHAVQSYERMEYLGDSILQLVVSEYLFHNFVELTSGELSKYRSHLVSTKNLSSITKGLHFDYFIKIGRALNKVSDALMADLFESVLAAIYLDGGIEPVRKFVMDNVIINKNHVVEVYNNDRDYKTELQEFLQSGKERKQLEYELVNQEMKDNVQYFTMRILIDGKVVAEVTKSSKKDAEKFLSKIALEKLTRN